MLTDRRVAASLGLLLALAACGGDVPQDAATADGRVPVRSYECDNQHMIAVVFMGDSARMSIDGSAPDSLKKIHTLMGVTYQSERYRLTLRNDVATLRRGDSVVAGNCRATR